MGNSLHKYLQVGNSLDFYCNSLHIFLFFFVHIERCVIFDMLEPDAPGSTQKRKVAPGASVWLVRLPGMVTAII